MAVKRQPNRGLGSGQSEGPATDRHNDPVADPSVNVLDLFAAGNRRQDDLRDAAKELSDCKHNHQKELMRNARETAKCSATKDRVHQKEMRKAEAGRLDAIRRVDREDANKRAADAQTAIATLAKGTSDAAEALRQQVASVEKAVTSQRISDTAEITKRVGALELAGSEGRGKQAVTDPAMLELVTEVKNLARAASEDKGKTAVTDPAMAELAKNVGILVAERSEGAGKSKGLSMMGAVAIGASLFIANIITAGIAIITGGLALYALMKPAPVQPVAVPIVAPAVPR